VSTAIQTTGGPDSAAIESVLVQGDLSKLSPPQRVSYYNRVCESLGLNPLTRPFEFINLSGKLVFYARRDCTDQLRNINNVTVRILSRDKMGEDVYVVTAQATLPNGRSDESTGAVPIARLQGEALANALMKAETKAKRRVTLSICGLSVLDESELEGVRDQVHPAQMTGGPITPHSESDQSPLTVDASVYDDLIGRIAVVKQGLATCKTYQQVLTLRELLGSRAEPAKSKLTRDIQAARATNLDGMREIDRRWAHCDREVAKLEKAIQAPGPEASFQDNADDANNPDGQDADPAEDFDR